MLHELILLIQSHDGINDKSALEAKVREKFPLIKDGRALYYTSDFAIRFCKAKSNIFSNCVLSLSKLKGYDHLPVIICLVTPDKNYMYLANTTFLDKISHSSQQLRIDNIRGTFLGTNIIRQIDKLENAPENFETLFSLHQNYTFEENLDRLVAATHNIIPKGRKFDIQPNSTISTYIMNAPNRALSFSKSDDYLDLRDDLDARKEKYADAILIAALIEDVKTRGDVIEYIIAGENAKLREEIITSLHNKSGYVPPLNSHGLGDYTKHYADYHTETDIKTKILVLPSNPKGFNIDKMLEFLSQCNTVFMLYLIGIDYDKRTIHSKLISMFQETLLDSIIIQEHWAGRNSRGVSQFNGEAIKKIILNEENKIDTSKAKAFLERIVSI